eukprot:521453_1
MAKNVLKYKKIKYLAIYIESNQNNAETTFLNGIRFNGNSDNIQHTVEKDDGDIIFDTTDKEHMKIFEQMCTINHSFALNVADSSVHLLNCDTRHTGNQHICNLNTCLHFTRLSYILNIYHAFVTENEKKHKHSQFDINDILNDEYPQTSLLNDFNHLLSCHCNEFEEIYNILSSSETCGLHKCTMMKRTTRDRQIIDSDDNTLRKLYFGYNDMNDITKLQLLDKIHCFYFHSFDIGYRFCKNDRVNIQNKLNHDDDTKHDDTHDELVMNICKEIKNKKCLSTRNSTKFSTVLQKYIEVKYSFGIRFFYWNYYRKLADKYQIKDYARHVAHGAEETNKGYKLRDWYIPAKYNNLKQELLHNKICTISEQQWKNLLLTAHAHLMTEYFMTAKSSSYQLSGHCYEMLSNIPISDGHLIAILIYCNLDILQQRFSETFRRQPKNESDKSLIDRHRNYHHLGRLLRESVECFGMQEKCVSFHMTFYHGISVQAQFSATNIWVKGPISTTTDYAVAAHFSANKGMILDIG